MTCAELVLAWSLRSDVTDCDLKVMFVCLFVCIMVLNVVLTIQCNVAGIIVIINLLKYFCFCVKVGSK